MSQAVLLKAFVLLFREHFIWKFDILYYNGHHTFLIVDQ